MLRIGRGGSRGRRPGVEAGTEVGSEGRGSRDETGLELRTLKPGLHTLETKDRINDSINPDLVSLEVRVGLRD